MKPSGINNQNRAQSSTQAAGAQRTSFLGKAWGWAQGMGSALFGQSGVQEPTSDTPLGRKDVTQSASTSSAQNVVTLEEVDECVQISERLAKNEYSDQLAAIDDYMYLRDVLETRAFGDEYKGVRSLLLERL